jgi:hypothetical protein
MVWPRVGRAYLDLGAKVTREHRPELPPPALVPASSLPELRLDHLIRLTDETGILQLATFTVPDRRGGYTVDDNARALIVALEADRVIASTETRDLVTTYLAFLQASQRPDGNFDNVTAYSRVVRVNSASEECLGRALWALGSVIRLASDEGARCLAREMVAQALPLTAGLGARAAASTLLGLSACLAVEPEWEDARSALRVLTDGLVDSHQARGSAWFEPALAQDHALLPLALFRAHRLNGERSTLRAARESLEFLEEICFEEDQLRIVGNRGWLARRQTDPRTHEHATDAAALVLAFRGAFAATGDAHYLRRMKTAFAWFMGSNHLATPVYNFASAGCRDSVGVAAVDQNEGAESTIAFLMALLEMMDVAGERIEPLADAMLSRN